MKTIVNIIAISLITISIFSQKLEKEIASIKKIEIINLYGGIKINGNRSDKLVIERKEDNDISNFTTGKSSIGYKEDNTQLGLNFKSIGKTLKISPSNTKAQFANYSIDLPKEVIISIENEMDISIKKNKNDIEIEHNASKYNSIQIKDMKNELNIDVFSSDIVIKNISGPIFLSAFAGSVEIQYAKYNQENPSMINLLAGNIEISLPIDSKFNIEASTLAGTIKSDFTIKAATIDLETKSIFKNKISGRELKKYENIHKIVGEVNKGGSQLSISTLAGNIKLIAISYPVVYPVYITQ
ncbi:hypothetical protein ACFLTE_01995 [Bacteroidota bacterium]